jgi:hypothetical protein
MMILDARKVNILYLQGKIKAATFVQLDKDTAFLFF